TPPPLPSSAPDPEPGPESEPAIDSTAGATPTPTPTPTAEPVLSVTGLHRSFGRFAAVDGLDLSVHAGEIYGFLGVNGAGKTTTIRMLMGIIAPDRGTIELLGEKSKRTTLKQKQHIGYVSQDQTFYPWMTAEMLGKFVGGLYPTWDAAEYRRLLAVLEVPANRKVSGLSGGMRVKLALALAIAPRPPLLILDEPTAGLDPVARREFLEIITHQAREYGRTTFFSTHLLDEVERAADRVGIIHQGKKRFEGRLDELQRRVREITLSAGAPLPVGFQVWRELDLTQTETGPEYRLIVEADSASWENAGVLGRKLPLDDIFIACVGISTTRL
ncbi:MAG: ABC transporter ATP-binding protein, partial [Verrucomicrobiales bacterium]|nr:ABC transporter ATP-binding protein [Verrucomicrobiales bacterium]